MTAVDRLDDHGRPSSPLEAGPARVSRRSSARSSRRPSRRSSRSRRQKYQAQIDEIDSKIKQAEQRVPTQRAAEIGKLDRELDEPGGQDRAARHAAAVQEGRARQQAQPLRRHDRARRGSARPRRYLNTTVADGREGARRPLAGARGGRRPSSRRKKAEKEKLLGYVDNLKKEREKLTREADRVKRLIEQKERSTVLRPAQRDGFRGPARHRHGCRPPRSSRSACPT